MPELPEGIDVVQQTAERAKAASRILATLDGEQRNRVLEAIAAALEGQSTRLLEANRLDLEAAALRGGDDALSPATLARLRLDDTKLREMVEQVRSVVSLPDPLGRVLQATELDDADPAVQGNPGAQTGTPKGLHLQKISVPLGLLAVIFEARPDAVTQIASLALKSGNAAILKPGREVEHTAAALLDVLRAALRTQNLPEDALCLVTGRAQVDALLQAHAWVDMVIPRGSKALVEYVQSHTRIPVLGHSEGVCHIYVDYAADPELAMRVILDAKLDYPAACNAVETVLVHRELPPEFIQRLLQELQAKQVGVHGDANLVGSEEDRLPSGLLPVEDWHTEFGGPELAVRVVASLDEAIAHIHHYGSAHTESILTEDIEAAERFLREVDAAGVFHNASTRFADGFRYGFGAEVGISTSKFHARGPVGLEGLTTYKYVLRGQGHVAGDYRGATGRSFTHRPESTS